MAKQQKVAEGYLSHKGVTVLAAEVAAMSESDFIKDAKAQAAGQPKGVNAFFSEYGEGQEAELKAVYALAKEAVPQAEAKAPAKQNAPKQTPPEA